MEKGKIYIVKNDVNDLVYIGQTIQKLNQRWSKHLSDAKNKVDEDNFFHSAINEIGKEHFTIELLEENIPQSQLNQKEKKWIEKFNSFYNGYNSCPGGNTGINLGTSKKIYQIDIYSNKVVKDFPSANEAARILNLDANSIRDCANGKNLTSFGFRWAWAENLQNILNAPLNIDNLPKQSGIIRHSSQRDLIYQIDIKTNEIIKTFKSIQEAANSIGVSKSVISGVLNDSRRITGGGYKWCYKEDLEETLKKEVPIKSINKGKKPIAQIDRDTGEIIATFESATDAAKILGINNLGIGKVCRGERLTYKNYIWKYI